jgi:FdhD protein
MLKAVVSKKHLKAKEILRWEQGALGSRERDDLACEEPLEIQVDTRAVSVTMRTPGHDEELAVGFLLTEGLIRARDDIAKVEMHPRNQSQNAVSIFLAPHVPLDLTKLTRHVFASSSCGLCGKATIDSVHQRFPPVQSKATVGSEILIGLPSRLQKVQDAFSRTGGLHGSAVFGVDGTLIVAREDVGRHNAVDKVLGHCLLHGLLPLEAHVLLVSGRASFEIMQKALAAQIPIVAAVSAPSSLAVEFAEESRQTLVGFLRGQRMNIYTEPQRIVFNQH